MSLSQDLQKDKGRLKYDNIKDLASKHGMTQQQVLDQARKEGIELHPSVKKVQSDNNKSSGFPGTTSTNAPGASTKPAPKPEPKPSPFGVQTTTFASGASAPGVEKPKPNSAFGIDTEKPTAGKPPAAAPATERYGTTTSNANTKPTPAPAANPKPSDNRMAGQAVTQQSRPTTTSKPSAAKPSAAKPAEEPRFAGEAVQAAASAPNNFYTPNLVSVHEFEGNYYDIEGYRDSSGEGTDRYYGPNEIHQLVNDGKMTWEQAERYFSQNQELMNNQHREGGKGRTGGPPGKPSGEFWLNEDGTGMNLYNVFSEGRNSAVANFDTDRFYDARQDVRAVYDEQSAEGLAGDGSEKARVMAMNAYYGTTHEDLGDFTADQFGRWHTQHHSSEYEKAGQGGDYWMMGGGPPPTPTPEPPPTPTPDPTPNPPPTVEDNDTVGVVDSEVEDGSNAVVGEDNATVGGDNEIDDMFNQDKDFTINNDNGTIWNMGGIIGSDLSVNFNQADMFNATSGTGGANWNMGDSIFNNNMNAMATIGLNDNRRARNTGQFLNSYMNGMAMSGLLGANTNPFYQYMPSNEEEESS